MSGLLTDCRLLIDKERRTFIKKEYGRLQALIGAKVWTPDSQQPHFFLAAPRDMDGRPEGEPYELSCEELASLPTLEKHVERFGTLSVFTLFQLYPQDSNRLALLAKAESALARGETLPEALEKKLREGHEAYMQWKLRDNVTVIMPERKQRHVS